MSQDRHRRLVIDHKVASTVRRAGGPTAWILAEELTVLIDGDEDAMVSVRELAGRLGIGRDAVCSARARLRLAGLVTVELLRGAGGRFSGACYRVDVPGLALDRGAPDSVRPEPGEPDAVPPAAGGAVPGESETPSPREQSRPKRAASTHTASGTGQLNLLDDALAPVSKPSGRDPSTEPNPRFLIPSQMTDECKPGVCEPGAREQ